MDVTRFEASPIGRIVPISGDYGDHHFEHFAYVPRPLPPKITLADETWGWITEAVLALGRLDGAGRRLPNPGVLSRPILRDEAISTSALEGTYTTLPQLLQEELFEEEEAPSRDVLEVLNYMRAANRGYAWTKTKPVTLNLVKELHAILLRDDPECPVTDQGEIRRRQNYIGPRNAPIEESHFVPPPPGRELLELLWQWEEWIHNENIQLFVRMAIGHYQFETLHPFVDGNGRLGRLIAVLMLLENNALTVPILSISPYFEDRRDQYQELLREVSESGDFNGWVRFFAGGLRQQAEETLRKADLLMVLRDEMVADLRAKKVRGIAIQIAEDLIGSPYVTPSIVRNRHGVTYQAALNGIQRLVTEGVLERVETSLRSGRRHVYLAPAVLKETS